MPLYYLNHLRSCAASASNASNSTSSSNCHADTGFWSEFRRLMKDRPQRPSKTSTFQNIISTIGEVLFLSGLIWILLPLLILVGVVTIIAAPIVVYHVFKRFRYPSVAIHWYVIGCRLTLVTVFLKGIISVYVVLSHLKWEWFNNPFTYRLNGFDGAVVLAFIAGCLKPFHICSSRMCVFVSAALILLESFDLFRQTQNAAPEATLRHPSLLVPIIDGSCHD